MHALSVPQEVAVAVVSEVTEVATGVGEDVAEVIEAEVALMVKPQILTLTTSRHSLRYPRKHIFKYAFV
jgi:hypothetical protein